MAKKYNKHGGGSKTNENGLNFERITSVKTFLSTKTKYSIKENNVFLKKKNVGIIGEKNQLYKIFLEPSNIYYKDIISKKLLPDEFFYNNSNKTIYIFEKKYQARAGSVDEKLQTCGFKKSQYQKLFKELDIKVKYIYILNDWFKQKQYKDVLAYIKEQDCFYFYNEIPIDFLKL